MRVIDCQGLMLIMNDPDNGKHEITLSGNKSIVRRIDCLASRTLQELRTDYLASTGDLPSAPTHGETWIDTLGIKFIYLGPGEFMMGSPLHELDRYRDEGPQHRVILTKGIWMGETQVTQAQWQTVMKTNLWSGNDFVLDHDDHPAVFVSWYDADAFCGNLNQSHPGLVRLPTEAEWEYACRAGTESRFSFGDDESALGRCAWFEGNVYKVGEQYAHSVKKKLANPWGLFDMHGNVWEWCQDVFHDNYNNAPTDGSAWMTGSRFKVDQSHTLRGGSWRSCPGYCRSANRSGSTPGDRGSHGGFRLTLDPL